MIITGHVQNGVVVFDLPQPTIAEGTQVRVDVPNEVTHFDLFKDIIGKAEDLPEDFALNHEHYRYGTPKR